MYKIYDQSINPDRSKRKPRVTLTREGVVVFNKEAVDLLQIKAGDGIQFLQANSNSKEWYVRKSDDKNAFNLRQGAGTSIATLQFNCAFVIIEILDSLSLDHNYTSTFLITKGKGPHERVFAISHLKKIRPRK